MMTDKELVARYRMALQAIISAGTYNGVITVGIAKEALKDYTDEAQS